MIETREKIDASQLDLKDTVVNISRVTKVVKGGKNLSFSALVVVGDGHGVVGFGVGKAKEVPSAIKKGIEAAKKSLIRVPLQGTTVPHPVLGRFGAGPGAAEAGAGRHRHHRRRRGARGGRGVGIQNVLTKSIGSANSHNVVRATFTGAADAARPAAVRAAARQGREPAAASRRLRPRRTMAKTSTERPTAKARRVKITQIKQHHRLQQDARRRWSGPGAAPDRPHASSWRHRGDPRDDPQGASPGDGRE